MFLIEELLVKGFIDDDFTENVKNAPADYLIRLLTFCAKADDIISSSERNYILDYFDRFDMNEGEETWLFAQYDYARFSNYNKETIISLKKSIDKLLDKKNLDLNILQYMITICLMDNDKLNNNHMEIISDYISIFKLNPNSCDKIYDKVVSEKAKNNRNKVINNLDNYDECYKILGLNKNCTLHDLKKRYAYLTKDYHPDKYSSEDIPLDIKKELEDKYKKINFAYDKLKEKF